MRVNYHTHTHRCKHASGTVRDYVNSAIDKELGILGISDHAPFPDTDYGYRMDYSELEDYIEEINIAKQDFSDKIKIYSGLEIEYFKKSVDYYERLLTKDKLDYLILGEHQYILDDGTHKNITLAKSTEWYIEYAKAVSDGLDTGYFKILAHPDLCMKNQFPFDSNCEKAFDIILNSLVKNNIIVEYNANGIRSGLIDYPDSKRYPYPFDYLWSKIAETNIKVVVSADCHNPNQIWDEAMDLSYANLEKLNIKPVEVIF